MVFDGHAKNVAAGLAGAAILTGAMIWKLPLNGYAATALSWAAVLSVGLVRGIRMAFQFVSAPRSDDETIAWGKRLCTNATFCGVVWGSSSLVLLPSGSTERDGLLVVIISLVQMGGAGANAIHRPLLLRFAIATGAVFAAGLLRFPDLFHIVLVIGFVVFSAVVIMFGRNQEDEVRQAIELRFEKERLLAVAEQARLEAESSRQAAERANQAKMRFVAAASHDLRQPMHALGLYVAHLKRQSHEPSVKETIEQIEVATTAMEDLLNAVLDFSKLAVGAIKPTIAAFLLDQLLLRLESQLAPQAYAKGIAFAVHLSGQTIESDEILLERILRNLALNAIRYTERGDVQLRAVPRGTRVSVQIWDTGIGIPKGEQEKIFDEYYQVDNRARDRRRGLGLGLAIVRQLADLLGHKLRLRSAVGKGSVFMLDVPMGCVASFPTVGPDSVVTQADLLQGACVLLVDDDPLALDSMITTLHDFGCAVIAATSGPEAITRIQTSDRAPHFIISDYRLGARENGIDVIRMVRQHHVEALDFEAAIPAVLVSGDTSPDELQKVLDAGLTMLHKPVKPAELRRTMNEMLASERWEHSKSRFVGKL